MTETVVGILISALVTVLASRYYFRRSIKKSLGVYGILHSRVFSGITADVRKQLHFRFGDVDVQELQQTVLLIANDGERSIRDVIEPLTLDLPPEVELLDASILHRHPGELDVSVKGSPKELGSPNVVVRFPLLNKGDFFVVKLLLSGILPSKKLVFRILADDLPRSLEPMSLNPAMLIGTERKVEWGLLAGSAVVLLFPAWLVYSSYLLWLSRPRMFPYPWASYQFSLQSLMLLIPGGLLFLLFSLIGLMMFAAALFGGEFPPSQGRKFPLPSELKAFVGPYHALQDIEASRETRAQPLPGLRPDVSSGGENGIVPAAADQHHTDQ